MRRFRLITWCWRNYLNPTKRDFRFKLRVPLSLLLSLLLYKACYSSDYLYLYLIMSLIILTLLIFFPKMIVLSMFILLICIISRYLINLIPLNKYIDGEYKIQDQIKMGSIIRVDNQFVLIKTKIDVNIGDIIHLKGQIKPIINVGEFDMVSYLNTHKISSIVMPKDINILRENNDVFNKIHDYVASGSKAWRSIAPMIILGIRNDSTKEIFEITKRLSIVHLFVISGFHIGIIYKVLSSILKKFKVPYFDLVTLIPLLVYLFLLNWTIPSLRAFVFIMFLLINKRIKWFKLSSLDTLGITGMIFIVFNPYLVNSISYILTFIASTTIIYINCFNFKYKISKYLCINIFVFLVTLPIVSTMNKYISVLGILYSIALTPFISFVYIISIVLLPFKWLLEYIYQFTILILRIFEKTTVIIKSNGFSLPFVYNYYIIFVICILFMEKRVSLLTMKRNELLQNLE